MKLRALALAAGAIGLCVTTAVAQEGHPTTGRADTARGATGTVQLAAVRQGGAFVPAAVSRDVPKVLASDARAEVRKRIFIRTLLPAVLRANAVIREHRRFLSRVELRRAAGFELDSAAKARLKGLHARYETEPGDPRTLRKRVDIVPPSLALAQAAIESGWGGSRFAQKGNALFGQRAYGCETCGMQPAGLSNDASFRVRSFGTVTASVRAYIRNLNTHPAYEILRARRHELRRQGKALDGLSLVAGLHRYSERGEAYVQDVRQIIAGNDLTDFDSARLAPTAQLARLPL
jgi:Bax protein